MKPEDVPADLIDTVSNKLYNFTVTDHEDREHLAQVLAAAVPEIRERVAAEVAPEIEGKVIERVAAGLREDAEAHRRVVARKPSEYDDARLARAQTLDDAAARVSGKRGNPCAELAEEARSSDCPPCPCPPGQCLTDAAVTVHCNDLASVLDDHQLWMLAQPADEQDWEAHDRLSVALDPEWVRDAAGEGGPGTAHITRGESR